MKTYPTDIEDFVFTPLLMVESARYRLKVTVNKIRYKRAVLRLLNELYRYRQCCCALEQDLRQQKPYTTECQRQRVMIESRAISVGMWLDRFRHERTTGHMVAEMGWEVGQWATIDSTLLASCHCTRKVSRSSQKLLEAVEIYLNYLSGKLSV